MNMIPSIASKSYSYWCSWQLQNIRAAMVDSSSAFGFTGHTKIAATLTEQFLEEILNSDMLTGARNQLYALLDLGWDVPGDVQFDGKNWMLGSMILAEDKFPSYKGTPSQRLEKLNRRVKTLGFKGLGLWIPANAYGDGKDGHAFTKEELKSFYTERFTWMSQAGIEYLKMDYGMRDHDFEFRKWITELAAEIDPNLIVEHAYNCGPFNDDVTPWDTPDVNQTGRFNAWENGKKAEAFEKTIRISKAFRTYDVSFCLAVPSTLDRTAASLTTERNTGDEECIINVESQPEIAAVLGCSMGIMECYRPEQNRACIRALNWQRIAPAWPVNGDVYLSDEILTDTWDFPSGSDWIDFLPPEYIVGQGAPAIISRGRKLPAVICDQNKPFVICGQHPNGAQSIAALPRRSKEQGLYWSLADIILDNCKADCPIAAFGRFSKLTLCFDEPIADRRLWAQDLLDDTAYDITEQCSLDDDRISIPSTVLSKYIGSDDDRMGVMFKLTD